MIEIKIDATCTEDAVLQMQQYFGGEISEQWGEYILEFNSKVGKGTIKCLTFDWGVSLMEFDAVFHNDLVFINDNSSFNPLHFSYVSKGQFHHRFCNEKEFTIVEQYHAAIIVSSKNLKHITVIPKDKPIIFNNIRVVRREYLLKRLVNVELLNEKLYKVFVDDKNELAFAYYSPINLKMEDHVKALRKSDTHGMTRILNIEGEVYQLLSMHIARHDKYQSSKILPPSLLNRELKIIKKLGENIAEDPAKNYSLELLSNLSGLSQAKLQEGFKFLYTRTVIEYIRHIRLEASRDLMSNTDLNVSQIVLAIGFTSRSYFSKILKEKYGLTPIEYKTRLMNTVDTMHLN